MRERLDLADTPRARSAGRAVTAGLERVSRSRRNVVRVGGRRAARAGGGPRADRDARTASRRLPDARGGRRTGGGQSRRDLSPRDQRARAAPDAARRRGAVDRRSRPRPTPISCRCRPCAATRCSRPGARHPRSCLPSLSTPHGGRDGPAPSPACCSASLHALGSSRPRHLAHRRRSPAARGRSSCCCACPRRIPASAATMAAATVTVRVARRDGGSPPDWPAITGWRWSTTGRCRCSASIASSCRCPRASRSPQCRRR